MSTENFLTNLFTIESSIKYLNETYSRETTWIKERVDKLKKAVDESDENVDLKISILENRLKPEILEWKTKHFEILKRLDGEVGAMKKKSDENKKLFDDIIEDYTSIVGALIIDKLNILSLCIYFKGVSMFTLNIFMALKQ